MATKDELKKIREMIEGVIGELLLAKEQMDELAEWDSPSEWMANIQKVTECIELIVAIGNEIQTLFVDVDDKELVKVIAEYLDDLVKLPFFLEPFDQMAFSVMINFALSTYRKTIAGNADYALLNKVKTAVAKVKSK